MEKRLSNPNKQKGSNYERELVNQAKELGLDAVRAYASNGKSLGKCEAVDLIIKGVTIQAKRRKQLANYMKIPDNVDIVVMREDRGESLAVVPFEKILQLIKEGLWTRGTS